MKEPNQQHVPPPVFSSAQEQNKAECAATWYAYAKMAEQSSDLMGAHMGYVNSWREQPEEFRYFQTFIEFLNRTGDIDELIKVYEIGIQLHRDHDSTFMNFANLLNIYGLYERAEEITEIVLAKDSNCLPAWGNLGNALRGQGKYDKAKACFEKILKVEPENDLASFNLSNILLSFGQYDRAWPLYESRLKLPGYQRLQRRNDAPKWQGEFLDGKCILVFAEQGLGDTFMFIRYLRMLAEAGAYIYFEVQKSVAWLMKGLIGVEVAIISRDSLDVLLEQETDFQIPLLSLPGLAHQRGWDASVQPVYLQPYTRQSKRASELIEGFDGLKVGLCWQGNPSAAIDCGRSLSLQLMEPLMEIEWIDFVSLQGRDGLEFIEDCVKKRKHFHCLPNLDRGMPAFAETVALIEGVDLVITSDTGIAHLAGSMGKECWVLLQKYPEWRWGLASKQTHWYPQMRLFRQTSVGNWESVIQEVKEALSVFEKILK